MIPSRVYVDGYAAVLRERRAALKAAGKCRDCLTGDARGRVRCPECARAHSIQVVARGWNHPRRA